MSKILLSLYKNKDLGPNLGFKGGTCAMFFYDLPRFSVDLDFDWLGGDYQKYLDIIELELSKFGKIQDKQDKFYTIYYELNYAYNDRNLKIEVSKRGKSGSFVLHNFMGESIWIMSESDLFSNKIFALLNRTKITNRDIFDVWFFLQKGVELNKDLLEQKVGKPFESYLNEVREFIVNYDFKKILYGMGELIDQKQKNFAKDGMKDQILWYLDLIIKN